MHTSLAHRLTVVALVLVGLATVGCGAAAAAPLDLRAGPREEPDRKSVV
jgi:hypothetical protein